MFLGIGRDNVERGSAGDLFEARQSLAKQSLVDSKRHGNQRCRQQRLASYHDMQ